MLWDFSWIIWSVLVSPKINEIEFGAQGHVRKSRNHRDEGVEGSHITKSKSYKFKMEQNHITELLNTSIHKSTIQIATQIAKKANRACCSRFFLDFL